MILKVLAAEKVLLLKDRIQTAINNSEDTLRSELYSFFESNPPPSVKDLSVENVKCKSTKR